MISPGNSSARMATESRLRMSLMVLANYLAIDHFLSMICMRYASYDQDVLRKVKLFTLYRNFVSGYLGFIPTEVLIYSFLLLSV